MERNYTHLLDITSTIHKNGKLIKLTKQIYVFPTVTCLHYINGIEFTISTIC